MMNMLKSDLFQKFMGGFLIGTVAVFLMQPASATSNEQAKPVPLVLEHVR